jgi:hypothetical protein
LVSAAIYNDQEVLIAVQVWGLHLTAVHVNLLETVVLRFCMLRPQVHIPGNMLFIGMGYGANMLTNTFTHPTR